MANRDLIVIGASAGGIEALRQICAELPNDLNAAVLIVVHTSSQSVLPELLSRSGPLRAKHAHDGERISRGQIYVAPPNLHMIVEDGVLRTVRGPRENRRRPAIDPTFRSAALQYNRRVIGVVLTGMLDDGTSGLMVIRARGGATVVQEPRTALFSSMPKSALQRVPDATVAELQDIPSLLVRLVSEEVEELKGRTSQDNVAEFETKMSELDMSEVANEGRAGTPSGFACPECGGVLWENGQSGFLRFRCRVGHSYTAAHLRAEQRQAVETALWSALRALEESASLYRRMAARAQDWNQNGSSAVYGERAESADASARTLREFLVRVNSAEVETEEQAEAG